MSWRLFGIVFSLVLVLMPACRGKLVFQGFQSVEPLCRADRPITLIAILHNDGSDSSIISPKLDLPPDVHLLQSPSDVAYTVAAGDHQTLRWKIQADSPTTAAITVELGDSDSTTASTTISFLPAVTITKGGYIPTPVPAPTTALIGALDCPLWESAHPEMWAQVRRHPERMPAFGLYDQANPEIADWETKWALEHGISFFAYCWYRAGVKVPVQTQFSSALDDALFKSKFQNQIKFAIIWVNATPGEQAAASDTDITQNLGPFWIQHYFKRPNYLVIDNKPVLFVFSAEALIHDCGGKDKVRPAMNALRQECIAAGFSGLTLVGQYWVFNAQEMALYRELGFDDYFAYAWYIGGNPTPAKSVSTQLDNLARARDSHTLPVIPTISQGWTGWGNEGTVWKLPPSDYETLLRGAKSFMATLPPEQLGSHMLLLDNWNEWGEGHYIAPQREYGFGYLDAIRSVFTTAPDAHQDLIPDDLGMGPYTATPFRNNDDAQTAPSP